MTDDSIQTTRLLRLQARIQAGDRVAQDELLCRTWGRLERLARMMLRRYPGVGRCAETGDVLQGSSLRLLRALQEVQPDSVRAYFGLAAQQVRRELIDLARHFYGPHGLAANQVRNHNPDNSRVVLHDPPDDGISPADLLEYQAFHEEVSRLPEDEREVMDLLYYQGLPQAETAALLNVSVRTVQRRWQAALLRLHDALGGEGPQA